MGETRDYLDAKRNAAIEEVQEILDELESLGEEYRIVRWLYFRGQILYKDLKLKEYSHDKEKEFLFA